MVSLSNHANGWATEAERGDHLDGLRMAQVAVNRCDDDPGIDRDQVDADDRQTHPGIDDDPLVENVIEHIDDAGARRATLQFGHAETNRSPRAGVTTP